MRRFAWSLITLAMLSSTIVKAMPIFNTANGHYYDFVDARVTWPQAKAAAEGLSYMGAQGHLATITSQEENDFLSEKFGSSVPDPDFWIGGFQPPGSPEPDGNWQWVTGEPFNYTNWYPGEPNDVGGNEPYLEIRMFLGRQWNDNNPSTQRVYLVEWDTPIPEPATVLLFGIGTLGIIGLSYRRKRAA